MKRALGSLRIAFSTASPISTGVHPECIKTVEETAKLLESPGHKVEKAQVEIDGHAVARNFLLRHFLAVADVGLWTKYVKDGANFPLTIRWSPASKIDGLKSNL